MELRAASLEYLIRILMNDLDQFISNNESIFDSSVYVTLESWMSYFDGEVEDDEFEIMDNQIHDYLGDMSIWDYDKDFQLSVVKRILFYFESKYGKESYVKLVADRVVNIYLEELSSEFPSSDLQAILVEHLRGE
ncbi:hypothetical protein M3194_15645 [Paenibacillus glycanilyticus]|uniref:hypothetical protein n=1 Tax=Paenibacillus glycanilyticus TaxID=126569 RepID=UPI00203EDBF0|nr:hypothetical protein [Paenibacillus glycanilyticus]MCM3628777.1 hypothetical protein [Paenibacillus glycanilyticus]